MKTFKPPSEMVERVGEALSVACMEELGATLRRGERQKFARAAIEAMREPTIYMLAAGQWVQFDCATPPVIECVEANTRAKQVYESMIDAAL